MGLRYRDFSSDSRGVRAFLYWLNAPYVEARCCRVHEGEAVMHVGQRYSRHAPSLTDPAMVSPNIAIATAAAM